MAKKFTRRYPAWTAYLFDENGDRSGGALPRYRVLAHLNSAADARLFARTYKKHHGHEFPGMLTADWAY